MSKISKETILHLARLSKITLHEDEIKKFRLELEAILAHVEKLKSIDTSGVEPTYQVTGLRDVAREDAIINYGVSQADLLKNAPDTQDNMIKVPKVL